MGCDLQEHRARIGTWAGRMRGCCALAQSVRVRVFSRCALAKCVLGATALCALLIIGGVEQNPGPGGTPKGQSSCTACLKFLRDGAQCDNCGKWFHVECNTNLREKTTMKWICIVCTTNRELHARQIIRCLVTELQSANQIIREIVHINGALQEELFKLKLSTRNENKILGEVTSPVTNDTEEPVYTRDECLILGDSSIRHVKADKIIFRVECFPGVRTEQLKHIIESGRYGNPQSVILHVGTYDAWRSIDSLTGDIYDLVKTAQSKFPSSNIILSGILRRRDMRWQRIRLINDNFDWVARCLGVLFVDPNSWVYEDDLEVDGVHLNPLGARRLGSLYSQVCESKTEKPLLEDNLSLEKSVIWNVREDMDLQRTDTKQNNSWATKLFQIMRQVDHNTTAAHNIDGATDYRNDSRVNSAKRKNGSSATYALPTALFDNADTLHNEEEVTAERKRSPERNNVTTAGDDHGVTTESLLGQEKTVWNDITASVLKIYSSALTGVPLIKGNCYNEIVKAVSATESDGATVDNDNTETKFVDEGGAAAVGHVNWMSSKWSNDQETTGQTTIGTTTSLTDDWTTASQEDVCGSLHVMTPIGTGRPGNPSTTK